jgi:hypothetical protein
MQTTLIGSTWIQGRTGSLDDDNNREYTRVFFVRTSDPKVGVQAVLATAGLPVIGEAFQGEDGTSEIDFGAIARRITPRQDTAAPQLWTVEVTYSVKPLSGGSADPNHGNPSQQAENPLDRPAQWEISGADYQRPVTHAIRINQAGTPQDLDELDQPKVVQPTNSAADAFDPQALRDDSDIVLTITRNEPAPFSMALARLYKNAVNTDTFFGAPKFQCRMKVPRVRNAFENNIAYVIVTYTIIIKEGYWDGDDHHLHLLDQGMRQLIDGKKEEIMDEKHGVAITAPVPLNGSGLKLDPPDSDQAYRIYMVYPELPFAPLGLE